MTTPDKYMMTALTISTMFVIFNIVAVLSGSATTYYSQIEQYIFDSLSIFDLS
jgi:hypothetical protein